MKGCLHRESVGLWVLRNSDWGQKTYRLQKNILQRIQDRTYQIQSWGRKTKHLQMAERVQLRTFCCGWQVYELNISCITLTFNCFSFGGQYFRRTFCFCTRVELGHTCLGQLWSRTWAKGSHKSSKRQRANF